MLFRKILCFFFCLYESFCYSQENFLSGHAQLLLVTTEGWNNSRGELLLYQRENDEENWTVVGEAMPVVVGRNGLAWGIGLHPSSEEGIYKKEGDGKSPAGVFSLGILFGFASSLESQMKYLPLNPFIEAVDDPTSRYYNTIVDRRKVTPDWNSSEKMGEQPLYQLGIALNHNFPDPKPAAGSAIFLHIWRSANSGTAGCTALDLQNLSKIISWLEEKKKPLLIQLPIHEYKRVQDQWGLPR